MVWYKQCDQRDACCRVEASGIGLEHCVRSIDGERGEFKESSTVEM